MDLRVFVLMHSAHCTLYIARSSCMFMSCNIITVRLLRTLTLWIKSLLESKRSRQCFLLLCYLYLLFATYISNHPMCTNYYEWHKHTHMHNAHADIDRKLVFRMADQPICGSKAMQSMRSSKTLLVYSVAWFLRLMHTHLLAALILRSHLV